MPSFFHDVDEARGAAVADAQPGVARWTSTRGLRLADHTHSVVVQIVVDCVFARFAAGLARSVFLGGFEQPLVVDGFCLRAPEIAQRGRLFLAHHRAVNAVQPRRSRGQVEHVALSQQGLRSVGV